MTQWLFSQRLKYHFAPDTYCIVLLPASISLCAIHCTIVRLCNNRGWRARLMLAVGCHVTSTLNRHWLCLYGTHFLTAGLTILSKRPTISVSTIKYLPQSYLCWCIVTALLYPWTLWAFCNPYNITLYFGTSIYNNGTFQIDESHESLWNLYSVHVT